MKKIISAIAVTGFGLTLLASAVQADMITTNYAASVLDWQLTDLAGESIMFDKFDSSLGILQSVNITLSGSLISGGEDTYINGSNGSVTNDVSSNPGLITATVSAYNYSGVATGPAALNNLDLLSSAAVITSVGPVMLNPGDSTDIIAAQLDFSAGQTINSGLSGFISAGAGDQFGYDLFTITGVQAGAIGGGSVDLTYVVNTYAKAELKVDYTYKTPEVPEPTSMLLYGVGFAGLVGTTIRRKKTKNV